MKLPAFLRHLFCRHRDLQFLRNIYGDEINACGGKRSWWRCTKCGAIKARGDLHDDGDLRGRAGPLTEHGWD